MPTLRSMALVRLETKISKMRLGDVMFEKEFKKFNIHPGKLLNLEPQKIPK